MAKDVLVFVPRRLAAAIFSKHYSLRGLTNISTHQALLHRFFGKTVIDFTPGSGAFAAEAVASRIGYFGVCFSEEHRESLLKRLQFATLQAMLCEGTAIYEPKAATFFKAGGQTGLAAAFKAGADTAKNPGKTKGNQGNKPDPKKSKLEAAEKGPKAMTSKPAKAGGKAADNKSKHNEDELSSLSPSGDGGGLSDWSNDDA